MLKLNLVDGTLQRSGLPPWMKEYIQSYVKGANIDTIKKATSFVSFGRKKGKVTKTEIILPNGTRFKKAEILHLIGLFYYGEDRISRITEKWAEENDEHRAHFNEVTMLEAQKARAIKNLMEGLGSKIESTSKELIDVFDYLENLESWEERIVAKRIILNYAFAKPFGYVFYRIFYPVSPEFMRSFGATFNNKQPLDLNAEQSANKVIEEGKISDSNLLNLTRNILILTTKAINREMAGAKRAGIDREAKLLKDISIAYPLHRLHDLGVDIDIKKEIELIKKQSRSAK